MLLESMSGLLRVRHVLVPTNQVRMSLILGVARLKQQYFPQFVWNSSRHKL